MESGLPQSVTQILSEHAHEEPDSPPHEPSNAEALGTAQNARGTTICPQTFSKFANEKLTSLPQRYLKKKKRGSSTATKISQIFAQAESSLATSRLSSKTDAQAQQQIAWRTVQQTARQLVELGLPRSVHKKTLKTLPVRS